MKNIIMVLAVLLLVGCTSTVIDVPVSNCLAGSGNVTDKNIGFNEFKSIELSFPANLYLTQGNRQRIRVEMEDNILEDMEIDVFNDVLIIKHKDYTCYANTEPINIYVTMEQIQELSVVGSGSIVGETKIVANELDVNIEGSGNIDLDVDNNKINVEVEGSGNIDLKGESTEIHTAIIGSGKIDADKLVSETAFVEIVGSGIAEVNGQHLDITIDGSGLVRYKGEPDTLTHSIEGSGEITKIN